MKKFRTTLNTEPWFDENGFRLHCPDKGRWRMLRANWDDSFQVLKPRHCF